MSTKLLARILTLVGSCLGAALDTSLFYICANSVFPGRVTWPVVVAVFWVQQTWFSSAISDRLREDGWL